MVVFLIIPELGYILGDIRPIAFTSCAHKLIERVLLRRLMCFVSERGIFSQVQIGFRPGCSIWSAHLDLETRIRLAHRRGDVPALVALDVAKAYDSVKHGILLHRLVQLEVPPYILAWIQEFF